MSILYIMAFKTKIRATKNTSAFHNSIPAIYQTNFIDIALWAWVTSASKFGITHIEAFKSFRNHFGLDEDSAPADLFNTKYWRINNRFIEASRSHRIIPNIPREHSAISDITEMIHFKFGKDMDELKLLVQKLMEKE